MNKLLQLNWKSENTTKRKIQSWFSCAITLETTCYCYAGALRGVCEGAEELTSTIFSMCFLMIVGSALGFTDTAHSSIIGGLGSGAGAGLEFCCRTKTPKTIRSILTQGGRICLLTKIRKCRLHGYCGGEKCHERMKIKISDMHMRLFYTT